MQREVGDTPQRAVAALRRRGEEAVAPERMFVLRVAADKLAKGGGDKAAAPRSLTSRSDSRGKNHSDLEPRSLLPFCAKSCDSRNTSGLSD